MVDAAHQRLNLLEQASGLLEHGSRILDGRVALLDHRALHQAFLQLVQAVLRLGAARQCLCEQHVCASLYVAVPVPNPRGCVHGIPNVVVVNSARCNPVVGVVPVCVVQAACVVRVSGIEPLQP